MLSTTHFSVAWEITMSDEGHVVSRAELESLSSQKLLHLIRQGNREAVEVFLIRHEAQIQRMVRFSLRNNSLRKFFETMDVFQSVCRNLFVRLQQGALEINSPEGMLGFLRTCVHNKLIDYGRKLKRQMALQDDPMPVEQIESEDGAPSEIVELKELVAAIRDRLKPEVRELVDLRVDRGLSWPEIARLKDANVDQLRKQLSRSVERVLEALNGDE